MQSWLEGRNWVGKCAQATGMTASLRILSSKADSNTWESFTRSELKLESVHQESPRSDIFRKRATKPLLNQKHRQKHLTWTKEKQNWTVAQWSKVLFQMKVHFAFNLEIKVPESGGREERHRIHVLEVQCEVSTVSDDLGCRVICWCWSTVFSEVHSQRSIYQNILEHFLLLTSFMEMLISFSSRTWHLPTLPKVPKAGLMTMVLLYLICQKTHLIWTSQRISGVLSRGRWETPDPTMQMTWRPLSKQPGLHYTGAVPQTDWLRATPQWCSNSCQRSPNQVLRA